MYIRDRYSEEACDNEPKYIQNGYGQTYNLANIQPVIGG